jgi:hypothetical protein
LVEEIYNRYETHDPGYLERDQMMVSHIRRIIPSDERAQYYTKLAEHQRRDTFLTLRDFLRARYESLRLAAISDVGTVKHVTNIQDDCDQDTDFSVIERQRAEDDEVLLASSEAADAGKTGAGAKALSPGTNVPVRSLDSSAPKQSNETGLVKYTCSYCAKDHPIWRCTDFKMLAVRLRYEHVREKRLCFHCLLPGHRIRDCKFRPDLVCGREGCKRKHHYLVHNHSDTGLCSIEAFLADMELINEPDADTEVQDSFSASALHTEDTGRVVLPLEEEYIAIKTVTLEIRCGDSKKRVLAALDSCSNNTNIDAALAEEMGLPVLRANIPREMHFLERTAHITSNFVKFVLAPMGSDATFEVSGFTVKDLMCGSLVVDWNQAAVAYPHLRNADIPKPKPGDRVQILLGVEFAEYMTPHKVLRGPRGSGAPIAELTDLGWAFSGRTNQKRSGPSSCQLNLIGHTLMALGTFDRTSEVRNCCNQSVGEGRPVLDDSIEAEVSPVMIDVSPVPVFTEPLFLRRSRTDVLTDFEFAQPQEEMEVLSPRASLIDFGVETPQLFAPALRAEHERNSTELENKVGQEKVTKTTPQNSWVGDETAEALTVITESES